MQILESHVNKNSATFKANQDRMRQVVGRAARAHRRGEGGRWTEIRRSGIGSRESCRFASASLA